MSSKKQKKKPKYERTLGGDLDLLAKLTRLAIDLDAIVQEFFVCSTIKHAIISRAMEVNRELVLHGSRGLGFCGFRLRADRPKECIAHVVGLYLRRGRMQQDRVHDCRYISQSQAEKAHRESNRKKEIWVGH